jgi:hypothetical protein
MALARGANEGFTDKYDVDRLLYWKYFDEVSKAINREKQLKGWRRSKKIALIEFYNPHWLDLARDRYPCMKSTATVNTTESPKPSLCPPVPPHHSPPKSS